MRAAALLLLSTFLGCLPGCLPGCAPDRVSSRSYRGHEVDADADHLVRVYPSLVGTRLDDCQTCHTGRIEDGRLAGSACDYCHDLVVHGTGHSARETLNPFGRDYLDAGQLIIYGHGVGQRAGS